MKTAAYRGCLLGLAIGDALGYAVDHKSWEEICQDYGPGGLMGYDLVNGFAETTSYTQIAAMAANGLLMGTTRGQLRGLMAPYVRYLAVAMKEWSKNQYLHREPTEAYCWVSRVSQLRRRRCMDTRMLDTLRRERLGTPEEPINGHTSPGMLTAAVAVGLFFQPQRLQVQEVGSLGAEAIALTHGDPMAFLSGSVLAYAVAGIVQDEQAPLQEHFLQAADAVAAQFSQQYPQAKTLRDRIHRTVAAARRAEDPQSFMEQLRCDDCAGVLCGAMYASLVCDGDFDMAVITAVNHSGCSCAVGAVCGAILGAKLGEDALPVFYMESLECVEVLQQLSDDLLRGCPLDRSSRLYDDDWDRKYIHAEPVETDGWAQ